MFFIGPMFLLGLLFASDALADELPIRIATFEVDATPPLGSPLCDGFVAPAERIVDPLSARGMVVLTDAEPIVLCVVDWVGISNAAHDAWCEALAKAADTSVDRVSVHVVHQHDAPGVDFSAEPLMAAHGLAGKMFHVAFARDVIERVAKAASQALKNPNRVTHIGLGMAKVEKVASNRRLLGPDGKVEAVRWSSCDNEALRALPEGTIDPLVRLLSFWDCDQPLACMSYYATHPQSYYGRGGVSADFVGMARTAREAALPGVAHLHFNGAGGNVTAGKYNDASTENRLILAGRLAAGMRAAWDATKKVPIRATDVSWRTRKVKLPPRYFDNEKEFLATLDDSDAKLTDRISAARDLAFLLRIDEGHRATLGCLKIGHAYVLHTPGELFVEYQLAAQAMRPDEFVCMAAYGDMGTEYIGTKIAYEQGGYETSRDASSVAPEVEDVLMPVIRELLDVEQDHGPEPSQITPLVSTDGPPPHDTTGAAKPLAITPLVRVVDLKLGESQEVELCDGQNVTVKLIDLKETRDTVRKAVRRTEVTVEVNGKSVKLVSATYHLPTTVGGVQIDCSITGGYLGNSHGNAWGLEKDARLRLWPAGSPLIRPDTFVYPAKQRWFATHTQMANVPTFVDGGEKPSNNASIYYHNGLDIGGAEGLVDVVAAAEGLVVSSGLNVLAEQKLNDTPVRPRYDVVYVMDARGWYYRYSHLKEIDKQIAPGRKVQMGDAIGVLGKEGGSGGWAHLHFEITSRQPSGQWGTQAGYAFLREAYLRQYKPKLIAVARPHHLLWVGEKAVLDATKSWSAAGRIAKHEWHFHDGTTATGPEVTRTYDKPGQYSEVLKITNSDGNFDYDFAIVIVIDPKQPDQRRLTIHPAYAPTFGIRIGDPVTFKVRTFKPADDGHETWDFGDGSPPVEVQSDGNANVHAEDGYAATTHRYKKPGHYLVRVERTSADGVRAMGHLHVRVEK